MLNVVCWYQAVGAGHLRPKGGVDCNAMADIGQRCGIRTNSFMLDLDFALNIAERAG